MCAADQAYKSLWSQFRAYVCVCVTLGARNRSSACSGFVFASPNMCVAERNPWSLFSGGWAVSVACSSVLQNQTTKLLKAVRDDMSACGACV